MLGHWWELEAYISALYVSSLQLHSVNFPNVCTKQPLGRSAFCREHHAIALSKNFPIEIRKVLQQYEKTGIFSYLNLHN